MRVINESPNNHPKLCNIPVGEAVMLVGNDGERGPFILMSPDNPERLPGTPAPWGAPAPPVGPSVRWDDSHDASLFDPINGKVYRIHGSSRARALKKAAFVVSAVEG